MHELITIHTLNISTKLKIILQWHCSDSQNVPDLDERMGYEGEGESFECGDIIIFLIMVLWVYRHDQTPSITHSKICSLQCTSAMIQSSASEMEEKSVDIV